MLIYIRASCLFVFICVCVFVVFLSGDIMASISVKEVLSLSSGNILMSQETIDMLGGITAFSEASDSRTHPLRFVLAMADYTENENGTKHEVKETTEAEPVAAVEEKKPAGKGKGGGGGKKNAGKGVEVEPPPPPPTPKVKSMVAVFEYWPPTPAALAAASANAASSQAVPSLGDQSNMGGSGGAASGSSGTGASASGGSGMRRRSITGPSPLTLAGADGYVVATPERSNSTSSRKRSLSSPAQPAINTKGGAGGSARLSLTCAGMIEGESPVSRLTLSPDGRWLGLSGADGSFTMHALPARPKVFD
jgi:hypothetical protein